VYTLRGDPKKEKYITTSPNTCHTFPDSKNKGSEIESFGSIDGEDYVIKTAQKHLPGVKLHPASDFQLYKQKGCKEPVTFASEALSPDYNSGRWIVKKGYQVRSVRIW
jgi:hypothetical protein